VLVCDVYEAATGSLERKGVIPVNQEANASQYFVWQVCQSCLSHLVGFQILFEQRVVMAEVGAKGK
jgi:hypothetical protein